VHYVKHKLNTHTWFKYFV